MKVLVVFSDGEIGGAERNLSKLALTKSDRIEYVFFSFKNSGTLFRYFKELGIIPLNQFISKLFFFKYLSLAFYLKENDIKYIYTCGMKVSLFFRILNLLGFKLQITNAIRCNLTQINLREKIIYFFEKKTSFLVEDYISNSKIALENYKKYFSINASKLKLIYNGIKIKEYNYDKINSSNVVLTVANLSKRKNHLRYLDIIKKFDKKITFKFVGSGSKYNEIQNKIRKEKISNCNLLGFQNNIHEIMINTKIFVLPSLYGEGCPTVIIEALSYGIPVIAFNIDGIPELITNDFNGYIIEKNNYKKLIEAIDLLLNDEITYQRCSLNAYRSSIKFSEDRFLELHKEHFLNRT